MVHTVVCETHLTHAQRIMDDESYLKLYRAEYPCLFPIKQRDRAKLDQTRVRVTTAMPRCGRPPAASGGAVGLA